MGKRGPSPVSPGELYVFAQDFYWCFRRLAEGRTRQFFDTRKHQRLTAMVDKPSLRLSSRKKDQIRLLADAEIRAGRLEPSKIDDWLRQREEAELDARRIGRRFIAAELASKTIKVPGEKTDLKALMQATKPEQVRRICKRAKDWPIAGGSVFPQYLAEYAEQFIAAKSDPRFPRSDRPTNELKQLWFVSRVLAGAVLGIMPRTAINLVGSKRPEQVFEDSRAAKPLRKRQQ